LTCFLFYKVGLVVVLYKSLFINSFRDISLINILEALIIEY